MGIWDRSIMQGRRILPNVAEPMTEFGTSIVVLRYGKQKNTTNQFEGVDIAPNGELYLYAQPVTSSITPDNSIRWATNLGAFPGTKIAYNLISNRVLFSGVYSAFKDAVTNQNKTIIKNDTGGILAADPLSGNFFTGGPSEIRRYSGDGALLGAGSRGIEAVRGMAIGPAGKHFFVLYDDLCKVDRETLLVTHNFTTEQPIWGATLATNGAFVCFMTQDMILRYYTVDFVPVWEREMTGFLGYTDVRDVAMDVYGDVYVAGRGEGNTHQLIRINGRNGELALDIEAEASVKHAGSTPGVYGVSVTSDGLVASISEDRYRIIAQT